MTTTKRKFSPLSIAIAIIVLVLVVGAWMGYNGLVNQEEGVNTEFANLQNQYQRRSDLVPQLVNTVKGYAKHESQTLEEVVKARAQATKVQISADELTPEKMRQFSESQNELSAAIGKLLAISENYPNLKASENFLGLQTQLEGTENRIAEARKKYNEAVKEYNLKVRRFPSNLMAGLFGFDKKEPFAAEAGAEKAPGVSFD